MALFFVLIVLLGVFANQVGMHSIFGKIAFRTLVLL